MCVGGSGLGGWEEKGCSTEGTVVPTCVSHLVTKLGVCGGRV